MGDSDPNPRRESRAWRRGRWSLPVVILLIVLGIAWIPPITRGYHVGFNLGTDNVCETRLGLQWCGHGETEATAATSPSPSETTESAPTTAPVLHEYTSPCALFVPGHDAMLEISGANAASDCERFVRASPGSWTTEPQASIGARGLVCSLSAGNGESATVTDTGRQQYGSEACSELRTEGWRD